MVLVALAYASIMLVTFGASAQAVSGHRISELLHVRDDVAQQTVPADQHAVLLQSARRTSDKFSASTMPPPALDQRVHSAEISPALHAAITALIDFIASDFARVSDRPEAWATPSEILAQRQRCHRSVVLHV